MKEFLEAYDRSLGNVSTACRTVGISRATCIGFVRRLPVWKAVRLNIRVVPTCEAPVRHARQEKTKVAEPCRATDNVSDELREGWKRHGAAAAVGKPL